MIILLAGFDMPRKSWTTIKILRGVFMAKFSNEEKIKIVLRYINGNDSMNKVAKEEKISHSELSVSTLTVAVLTEEGAFVPGLYVSTACLSSEIIT